MSTLPLIYLARHGETAWSLTGQHTGRTDIPLTKQGEKNAQQLGMRLQSPSAKAAAANEALVTFAHVFSSPLQRAMQTASLAGFKNQVIPEPLLLEWNYGDYEGITTKKIHETCPDWQIFRDGCPGGESPDEIAGRCDEMVKKLRSLHGNILLFAHAHILRMLTTRWLGLPPNQGRLYFLNTASLSILGYEHHLNEPVIHLWNDTSHLEN